MRKINIHLTLEQRGLQYCYEVNSGIRKITTSIIEFGQSSPMVPHISLIMGELNGSEALPSIVEVITVALEDYMKVTVSISAPYLENVRNRYVFSDVNGGEPLTKLKNTLHAILNGTYLKVQSDYADQPHLTLGHIEERRDEVQAFLQDIHAGLQICCPAIEISDVGSKGSCINSLWKYDLK